MTIPASEAKAIGPRIPGLPVGASGAPDDGDGDGFYTAVPGGEDNVPMPAGQMRLPGMENIRNEWSNVQDILDWEVFDVNPDEADYDDYIDARQRVVDYWAHWVPCRQMREQGYRLAGLDPGEGDQGLRAGMRGVNQGGMVAHEDEAREGARLLMGELVEAARAGARGEDGPLYRAGNAGDDDAFMEVWQPGALVDVPLLAFADRRAQGREEFLSKFGSGYLIEVEAGAMATPGGDFDPMYSDRDEEETLSNIEDLIAEIASEMDGLDEDSEEYEELADRQFELEKVLSDYKESLEGEAWKREEARDYLINALEDAGLDKRERPEFYRWAGQVIDEDDSEFFYDAIDNPGGEQTPQEIISGGRFEVLSVDDDPKGEYDRVIRVRQVGVFDPQNPGVVVPVQAQSTKAAKLGEKRRPVAFDDPSFSKPLATPREKLKERLGRARSVGKGRKRVGANQRKRVRRLTRYLRRGQSAPNV